MRTLELDVARMGQRVQDHETDIRAFGPLVTEQATTRKDIQQIVGDLRSAHDSTRRLEERFERHVEEIGKVRAQREEREREQEARDRRYRITTWIAAAGLLLTFVGTMVAVIAVAHP